jgi:hypothetical protein
LKGRITGPWCWVLPASGHASLVALPRTCGVPGCATLWVPETLHTSRDLLIFVDQSTDLVASSDVVDLGCCAVGEWS